MATQIYQFILSFLLWSLTFMCLFGHTQCGHERVISCDDDREPVHPTMDRAFLTLVPHNSLHTSHTLSLWGQVEACWKCPLQWLADVPTDGSNCTVLVDSRFKLSLEIRLNDNASWPKILNSTTTHLTEYGEAFYLISETQLIPGDDHKFMITFVEEPNSYNCYTPLFVALGVLIACAIMWGVVRYLHHKDVFRYIVSSLTTGKHVHDDLGNPLGIANDPFSSSVAEVTPPSNKQRLLALDTFRGFCLCIMIFVNYGGGGYWFFDHSFWNGLTVADLVMPWFTWIIGTAVALSQRKALRSGTSRIRLILRIILRTLILFLLGLAINSSDGSESVAVSQFRIPGVLQRLGVSYCVVALLHLPFNTHSKKEQKEDSGSLRDILPYWPEWLVMLALLAIHLMLTFLLQAPGCPRGYLGPGGLHDGGKYMNCTGGAAGLIDRWLFGDSHIYQTPTCQEIYKTTVPHDPEGILGTLTSVVMCFLGLQAGKILMLYSDWVQRIRRWLVWSVALGVIAAILSKCSQNDGWIPLNKNLWSVSFILALTSMAFLLLTVLYLLTDVYNLWSGAPFFYPGRNSILVYLCHLWLENYFPVSWQVPRSHASLLPLHLWGVVFWVLISMGLHHKGLFITI